MAFWLVWLIIGQMRDQGGGGGGGLNLFYKFENILILLALENNENTMQIKSGNITIFIIKKSVKSLDMFSRFFESSKWG